MLEAAEAQGGAHTSAGGQVQAQGSVHISMWNKGRCNLTHVMHQHSPRWT